METQHGAKLELHCSVTVTHVTKMSNGKCTGSLKLSRGLFRVTVLHNVNLLQAGYAEMQQDATAVMKKCQQLTCTPVFCCDDCGGVEEPELFCRTVHTWSLQAQGFFYLHFHEREATNERKNLLFFTVCILTHSVPTTVLSSGDLFGV